MKAKPASGTQVGCRSLTKEVKKIDNLSPSRAASRVPTRVTVAYGAMATLLAGYITVKFAIGAAFGNPLEGWLAAGFELLLAGMCLARAIKYRGDRIFIVLLGAALLAWSIGDLVLAFESLGGATVSVPSVADCFYLSFFPLMYLAISRRMRDSANRSKLPVVLDGLVAGLGAAAICATFLFSDLTRLTHSGGLATATNLAYPAGDILLLLMVVGLFAISTRRVRVPLLLLAAGSLVNIVGDTFNLFGNTSMFGVAANAMAWPISILLFSLYAWKRYDRRLSSERDPSFVLPGLAAVASLSILSVGTIKPVNNVAIALAITTLAIAGVRAIISARSLREITRIRHQQSITDHLTGLGNRRQLFQLLPSFTAEDPDALVRDLGLAFLFIDLNGFKSINDSFGHPAGDEVLKQVAQRLETQVRDCDVVTRIGGDEFAVLLMNVDATHAQEVATRISDSFEAPFKLAAVNPRLTVSIGIALAPVGLEDHESLISCADAAMFKAKTNGIPFAMYEQGEHYDNSAERLHLGVELSNAIEAGQLELYYQPQLDLLTGQVNSVESLLRWNHPDLGMVPPLKFLPIATQIGMMQRLTQWVLDEALEQCAAWRAAGRNIAVAVNIAAESFIEPGFTEFIEEVLERHEVPPNALILELTETSILRNFEETRQVIEKLDSKGIVVSIDDFGAGFTSLAYLNDLSVRELKLDRTFVTGHVGGEHPVRSDLVRSTIALAHSLNLRVVCEGIEERERLEEITRYACDLAQGYLIEKPRPAAELTNQELKWPSFGEGSYQRAAWSRE